MLDITKFLKGPGIAAALLLAPVAMPAGPALAADPVTLTYSNWLPPTHFIWTDVYRPFLAAIARHRPGGRLLDLGCALGVLLGVAREAGFDAYGLDLNAAAVADARREFGDRAHAGPLDDTAFPGVRFDAITLIDVLEHVPDPEALLETLASRLAPEGVIAAVLPDAGSLTARLFGRRWPHYNEEHLFYWSASNLRTFLQERGWRVLALRRGVLKTYTARYLDHYARQMGRTPPPGLRRLGDLRLRLPTGEMLVIAARPKGA